MPLFLAALILIVVCCLNLQQGQGNKTIPPIIFRSHEDDFDDLHPKFQSIFNETLSLNKNYTMVYFSEKERVQFIKSFYPHYLDDYLSCNPGAFRSDIWRLLVVYRYGGVYSDLSIQYIMSLDYIIREFDELVGIIDLDPKAMLTSFIAAYPQHPVIRKIIEVVMDNVHNRRYQCGFLDITGPRAWGRAFSSFFGDFSASEHTAILRNGCYNRTGFQFRFFDFSAFPSWVISENGIIVMRNKFDGYKGLIYRNKTMPYNELYYHNKVFHDDHLKSKTTDFERRNFLFRNGKSLRYIYERQEFLFPDYDTFLNMGFENCMASKEFPPLPNRDVNIPEILLSGNILDNVYLVNLWGKTNATFVNTSESFTTFLSDSVQDNLKRLKEFYPEPRAIRFCQFMAVVEMDAHLNLLDVCSKR